MWTIQLFELNFDHREVAASEVIQGGWLSMGKRVAQFESQFSAFFR